VLIVIDAIVPSMFVPITMMIAVVLAFSWSAAAAGSESEQYD
jgi:hypothetical protein